MSTRRLTVTFDAHDPARVARFWSDLLQRPVATEPGGAVVAGDDTQVGLRFVAGGGAGRRPNDLHLHLTSERPEDQGHTVDRALELGAAHLDVGQRPEEGHIVLADPEGNAFCVIEAGNAYLAGTGFLGEVACDGAREVGLFWSAAMEWPLVWDQDEETAIQSPRGGTKVAWGGPPDAPKDRRNRQRFDLVPPGGDQAAEVERLVALGATRLGGDEDGGDEDGAVELADPGGNEFRVLTG